MGIGIWEVEAFVIWRESLIAPREALSVVDIVDKKTQQSSRIDNGLGFGLGVRVIPGRTNKTFVFFEQWLLTALAFCGGIWGKRKRSFALFT